MHISELSRFGAGLVSVVPRGGMHREFHMVRHLCLFFCLALLTYTSSEARCLFTRSSGRSIERISARCKRVLARVFATACIFCTPFLFARCT